MARALTALDNPHVGEVRGLGLMPGVELVADLKARRPFAPDAEAGWRVQEACRRAGVLVRALGDVITLSPPLVITEEQADHVVAVLGESLGRELGTA